MKKDTNAAEVHHFRSELIDEAAKKIALHPAALQITILVSFAGEIISYPMFDLNDEHAEERFFSQLQDEGKTRFEHVLTMWSNHAIDVPKRSFLLRLRELDENNKNCCVLLQDEKGVSGFQLSRLL